MSMDPFDEAAELTVAGEVRWLEATTRVLTNGRDLIELHDEDGEVIATVSLRPGFMLRREHARSEAAA